MQFVTAPCTPPAWNFQQHYMHQYSPMYAPQMGAAAMSMMPTAVPSAHVFNAAQPWQMSPVQMAQVQDSLAVTVKAAEKNTFLSPPTKQQQHGELAKAIRKKPVKERSSKKGTQERQYSPEDFLSMVEEVLRGGPGVSSASVAKERKFPSAERSLQRYVADLKAMESLRRPTEAESRAAQIAYASETLELKQKGNVDLMSRRLFSEDELDYFARALKLYGEMGWPMDYQDIRHMMSQAAADAKRVDWKSGQPYVCSTSYVAAFVRSRPELRAYKTSHIDPLRSKKATAQAPDHEMPCRRPVACVVALELVLMSSHFSHSLGESLEKFLTPF
jgi:hypothetical protein